MTPKTVAELIAWFEQTFECFQGPPKAFFEIPTGPNSFLRMIYTKYAVRMDDVEDAERILIEVLFTDFEELVLTPSYQKALFWRLPEKIVLSRDMAEGSTALRTRLVIPALQWIAKPMKTRIAEGCCILKVEAPS